MRIEEVQYLLEYRSASWVSFITPLYLPYEEVRTEAVGLYNYVEDIHVFWTRHYSPEVTIISLAGLENSAGWIWCRDNDVADLLLNCYEQVRLMLHEIKQMDTAK